MDKLPIDFDMTLKELSEWIDNWKVERYGKDSLNPERYYNTSVDGRFLYGVREGESLNREKADIEKGMQLLVQIKNINDKLCGRGISQHLQWQERADLERERETLYKEFTELVQSSPDAAAQGDGLTLPDDLYTQKAQKTFVKAIEKGWMQLKLDGSIVWLGIGNRANKAQLAYLCAKVYGYRYTADRGNIGDRVPYEALESIFNVTRLDRATQQVFESVKPQRWREQIDRIITE